MTTDPANDPQAAPVRRRRPLIWTGGVVLGLVITAVGLASAWDWNWFRGPLAAAASARMRRQVSISGDLRVHLWSWEPSATVDGVRIANPAWAPPGALAQIDHIALQIRLAPLFLGHTDIRLLEIDRPRVSLLRNADGRRTWDFSDGARPDEPLRLPPIHKLVIDGGRLDYRDEQRGLLFSGAIDARERLGEATKGFQLNGKGVLNARPFELLLTGGPLLNIDREKPYPFKAEIHADQTYLTADGAVPKPFDLARFSMSIAVRGPDLAELYVLTGLPLPDTPPFDLHGRLSRDMHLWKIEGINGRVGSSDLAGQLSVRTGARRPFLTADLASRRLNFRDLGALFGGARRTGAVASPEQRAAARSLRAEARIFPDATLNFSRFRALDADVRYKAATITGAPIHLRAGSARVKMDAGLLRTEPLDLDLPQGHIVGFIQLDGRKRDAITDLDLRLVGGRLETIVPVKFQGAAPFAGPLVGRVRLHGVGDSVRDAMADASGEALFVVTGGEIRRTLAELAGVDLIKGLGLLFAKDQATTPLRCAVLHFSGKDGVLSADRLIVDTGPVLIDGGGAVNLDTEKLSFTVKGHPKKFQLVRLIAPISVTGSILTPKISIRKGGAVAQGGVAIALGMLLSPIAALLPFVDPGLAKDTDCAHPPAQAPARAAR